MGISEKLLGSDERVVRHMHSHIKELFFAGIVFIILVASILIAWLVIPDSARPMAPIAITIVAVVAMIWLCFIPWLRWHTDTYTVTTRRIITRTGIFTKRGHDIPLYRISNVAYENGIVDRLFGCGTLVLETSADNPLYLHDIPSVEKVHVELTELLFDSRGDDF